MKYTPTPTPTPWITQDATTTNGTVIVDSATESHQVAGPFRSEQGIADAQHICRAVNAYQRMVMALNQIAKFQDFASTGSIDNAGNRANLRAARAIAKEALASISHYPANE